MRLGDGKIIGGYSPTSWESSGGGFGSRDGSYLFSITNGYWYSQRYRSCSYSCSSHSYWSSIYRSLSYGPTFGAVPDTYGYSLHDLYVSSDMRTLS